MQGLGRAVPLQRQRDTKRICHPQRQSLNKEVKLRGIFKYIKGKGCSATSFPKEEQTQLVPFLFLVGNFEGKLHKKSALVRQSEEDRTGRKMLLEKYI